MMALAAAGLSTLLPDTTLRAAPVEGSSAPLPVLGDSASEDLSVGAERRLGDRIMQEIRQDPDMVDDPLLIEYVQSIWTRLVAAARARGELSSDLDAHFPFEIFLVRDRSVNAFALPGGYVGIHLGLLAMTASADELAAVMAHELSHVTQRHIARSMSSSKRRSLVGMATMILGVMAAARANAANAANAAIVGGQAAMIQGQLNFSRDMEREADRVGFGVLDQAGFAPAGMASMFDKLLQASRLSDSQQYPYLRSHPLTSERIGEARARLGADVGTALLDAASVAQRWEHAAMQGRARALMDPRAVSLQRLVQGIDTAPAVVNTPDQIASLYAATVAAERMKDWRRADEGLERLQSAVQRAPALSRPVTALRVEMLVDRGRGALAQQVLAPYVGAGGRFELLMGGRAALVTGQELGRQREALQSWVVAHPRDAQAWQVLGQVQDRMGEPLAALRSQAEAQFALGDVSGAVDRLRAAQRNARARKDDSMDSSIIEARLRQLEERLRQRVLEEKDSRTGG